MKPDFNDDVFFAGIAELNDRLKKREFSAVELARAFGERLQTLGPRYNALATPLTEVAVRRAKDVDDELKHDRLRGPLQGVPFGAKDLLAFAGHPTTWGAKPFASQVFDQSATVLQKLDKIGALLVGKLAMVELAGGPSYRFAAASLFGPGLNPWDLTRWSGGSSSGSGSAVAAGLVPFALGSETSGSILTPSAFCGVTGLRPTYGMVSRHGAMPLAWTLDKIGPMCRSAEDCGLVLQAIAGGNDGKAFYYAPDYNRPLKELKLGFAPADLDQAEPEARAAFEAAMKEIAASGATMTEAKLPDFPYGALVGTVVSAEGSSVFEPLIASGKVNDLADERQIEGLKAGLEIPAKDYLKAMRVRTLIKSKFRELFAGVDLLVAPARYGIAPKISEPLDGGGNRAQSRAQNSPGTPGMTSLIAAGNLAGLPALSLPCGFAQGMPLALQLVGPAYSENTLLAVGREFQKRTDWNRKRPPGI